MKISDDYKPSVWGDRFHRLDHEEALGAGAAGPGKSLVLLYDPIWQQVRIEHARCTKNPLAVTEEGSWLYQAILDNPLDWGDSTGWALHLRRTSKSLSQTLSRATRMFKKIDPDIVFNREAMTFTFRSGFRYQFGHCHRPDDWQGYMSQEYTWIGYDELFEFEEEQFDQINTRCRSTDPVLRHFLKSRAMSNPVMKPEEGLTLKDPFWVRRRFVDPCPAGNTTLKSKVVYEGKVRYKRWIYLPATIDDNPDKDFVEQYKMRLASAKPHIRAALLYGDWYYTVGAHYSYVWSRRLHVVKPFKIPHGWKIFRSMDWGFKKQGCVGYYAMDKEDNLVKFYEYNFRLKHVDEVAKDLMELELRFGVWDKRNNCSRITGPADTQLWEERGDVVKNKAEHFSDLGFEWVKADKASRKRNSELLIKRLNDHSDGTAVPGIVFFSTCRKTINTIPMIPSKKEDPECPADGGEDHWHDETLYACAFASHGREGVPDPSPEKTEDDERESRLSREARGGKWGYGQRLC